MPTNPASNDDFREQLSAWHDGALSDEAARFVLKRLLADDTLRAEVGRWQAVGDVLRRERQQVVAGDLPARVAVVRAGGAPLSPPERTGVLS
jgi:negative regulator of sigma E activity